VTEVRVAALYTVALVPAGGLALALSGWVMDLSKHQAPELPSGVDGWALNIVPAFATGLLVFLALARFVGGTDGGRPLGWTPYSAQRATVLGGSGARGATAARRAQPGFLALWPARALGLARRAGRNHGGWADGAASSVTGGPGRLTTACS
jgi:hypothetical protein